MIISKNRQLVTYILFAYNQERFIRDAVNSAFAQTYQPLEIILSDDCSADQTFNIMQDMVAAYRGPHRVRLVRNSKNLGIFAHVLARGKESNGEIVVVAAGDDVSVPERTECLVDVFENMSEVYAVFSSVKIINEFGHIISSSVQRPLNVSRPVIYIKNESDLNVIQGCSAAYKKSVFWLPLLNSRYEFPEDIVFSFYINIMGWKIERVQRDLVFYRCSNNSISNKPNSFMPAEDVEITIYENHIRNREMLAALSYLSLSGLKFDLFDQKKLMKAKILSDVVLLWPKCSIFKRICIFFSKLRYFDYRMLKWMFLRMFGNFPSYQPRLFLSKLLNKLLFKYKTF